LGQAIPEEDQDFAAVVTARQVCGLSLRWIRTLCELSQALVVEMIAVLGELQR
jgi:hypothetical protein